MITFSEAAELTKPDGAGFRRAGSLGRDQKKQDAQDECADGEDQDDFQPVPASLLQRSDPFSAVVVCAHPSVAYAGTRLVTWKIRESLTEWRGDRRGFRE